ncbi:hypothetical protein DM860_017366 [Cuscuta australis]|uniref:Uncharacterized protein n=1 Tax=Cuscuta australis TaxID=267555 RepID=A0A328DHY0_9ASTE|nr:hypothetical protein DM860_017366 [Cuscuta australis]
MGRQPCCDKTGLKKGPWTAEEDKKLMIFILNNGQCCWRAVPKLAGLLRCGKSCRLRWINYLRPDLKRGLLSESEEKMVIDLHAQLGNKWSKIASHLPGRTDNEIKNLWNTHIKKKLRKMGVDPITHKPLVPPRDDDEKEKEKEKENQKTEPPGNRSNDGSTIQNSIASTPSSSASYDGFISSDLNNNRTSRVNDVFDDMDLLPTLGWECDSIIFNNMGFWEEDDFLNTTTLDSLFNNNNDTNNPLIITDEESWKLEQLL